MENAKFIAKVAKALGDRHRLVILHEIFLKGSVTITQAQELSNLAQPSVSHHIKQLTECGLVDASKIGRVVHLQLNRKKMDEFIAWFGKKE
ncbi:MAG: metalloregulator ArsR/SmtB family transcription factor [Bacteroidota bacterium]